MRVKLVGAVLLAVILLICSTGPAAAGSGRTIKVIIGLNSGVTDYDENLIKGKGGSIGHRFHLVNALTAEVPVAVVPFLRLLNRVSYVELDTEVQAVDEFQPFNPGNSINPAVETAAQQVPWGVSAVNAPAVQAYNQGSGVKVAVIDTGIDLDHPDLNVAGNVNLKYPSKNGDDDNGHGSHVAGTVAALDNALGVLGVAPLVDLYAVKVLDSNGSGYWSDVIQGIEWAIDNDMDIINLSLGSSSGSNTLRQACQNAWDSGVLIVAAAGNSGASSYRLDNVIYPARYSSVIAVGAVDSSLTRPGFSCTGTTLELAAPGVSVYSTYKNGGYATLQGTSMASPHVAGAAALVIASGITDSSGNGLINDEVRERLVSTATDLGSSGWDSYYGYGLVNALDAAPDMGNHAPVADAGPDQTVFVNTPVTLDGSASSDRDLDALTYTWTQSSGEIVELDDTYAVSPVFTPLVPGLYSFSLTVNDGEFDSPPDEVAITVRQENSLPGAPVVSISPVVPLTTDDLVCRIVTESPDADSDPVSYFYAWYKEAEVQSGLTTATVPAARTLKGQTWSCRVTPFDGYGYGPSALAAVEIVNSAPEAEAGADQTVLINRTVTLNGAASVDADGDALTCLWTQLSGPEPVVLSDTAIFSPSFTTAVPGSYLFSLTVTDSEAAADTDTVTVTVNEFENNILHCQSIEMTLSQNFRGFRTSATARVSVVDEFGNAVSGVKVRGHWTGATSGAVSGLTGSDGTLTLYSSVLRYPSAGTTYVFTLDSLSKDGWTYTSENDVQNSGSVSVP